MRSIEVEQALAMENLETQNLRSAGERKVCEDAVHQGLGEVRMKQENQNQREKQDLEESRRRRIQETRQRLEAEEAGRKLRGDDISSPQNVEEAHKLAEDFQRKVNEAKQKQQEARQEAEADRKQKQVMQDQAAAVC